MAETDQLLPQLMIESHRRLTGTSLVPDDTPDAPRWLYAAAPFGVVAHNAEPDPRFVYANQAAQRLFEYSWAEFTTLPSRLSAETPNRAERQALLDQVARQGFASGYRGLRIAKSGRRFWIEDATVWQLIDAAGATHGQAAVIRRWREVDGA